MEFYSGEKAVIGPELFKSEDLNEVKVGIMVFVKRVYDWMRSVAHDVVLEKSGVIGSRSFFTTKDGLGVFHSYFGAPAAVTLLETLGASGVKTVAVFGQAGSISPDVKPGEILVPTFAIREEGTSYHYLPPETVPKPSNGLKEKIEKVLRSQSFSYREGGVWTTDAVFRETWDKVLRYSSQGVLGVEMECSALFSVGQYREAEVAALLVVTDELHGKEWKPAFNDPQVMGSERKVSEALLRDRRELMPQVL